MTAKRFKEIYPNIIRSNYCFTDNGKPIGDKEVCDLLNEQHETIEQLKQDVEYWKQVASQYSNELNVFEHCKKYKTECKDIYWSSD